MTSDFSQSPVPSTAGWPPLAGRVPREGTTYGRSTTIHQALIGFEEVGLEVFLPSARQMFPSREPCAVNRRPALRQNTALTSSGCGNMSLAPWYCHVSCKGFGTSEPIRTGKLLFDQPLRGKSDKQYCSAQQATCLGYSGV